ncbi:MAG: GNVR domain-containing protein, partial [Xanthobacteraceae bacterium]
KAQAAASGGQDVELRALEREAKAQRDLLESYLAKYREANARDSMSSAPAEARIISRAILSNTPSFPKKVPIVLIATLATLILSAAAITTGELLAGNVYRAADLEEEVPLVPDATVPIAASAPPTQQAVTTSGTAAADAAAETPAPPDPRIAARKAIAELVEALRAATPSESRHPVAAGRT